MLLSFPKRCGLYKKSYMDFFEKIVTAISLCLKDGTCMSHDSSEETTGDGGGKEEVRSVFEHSDFDNLSASPFDSPICAGKITNRHIQNDGRCCELYPTDKTETAEVRTSCLALVVRLSILSTFRLHFNGPVMTTLIFFSHD